MVLQRANHFQTRTVAYMAETLERVSAKCSLQDVAGACAIK
jgi:hypothetical protein